MKIENKKLLSAFLLAVGLILIAVVLTGQFIQTKIEERNEFLVRDFQKKNAALIQQMDLMAKELVRTQREQVLLNNEIESINKYLERE